MIDEMAPVGTTYELIFMARSDTDSNVVSFFCGVQCVVSRIVMLHSLQHPASHSFCLSSRGADASRGLTNPELSSTAKRTITIIEPCDAGDQFCEDDRTCSKVLSFDRTAGARRRPGQQQPAC